MSDNLSIQEPTEQETKSSLFQLYHDFLYKYLSILMLTGIASIGYAISILDKDIDSVPKIMVGLSIISWSVSVASGILSLKYTLNLLEIEYNSLNYDRSKMKDDDEVHPEDRQAVNFSKKRNRIKYKSSNSFTSQLLFYVIGMILFLTFLAINTNWSNKTKTIGQNNERKAPAIKQNAGSIVIDSSKIHNNKPAPPPKHK